MTPEQYEVHAEQVLRISEHPLIEGEDEKPLAGSCLNCGTILPTDTSAWNGECPRCRYVEIEVVDR